MTPLEKALAQKDEIDYCDQCEYVVAVKGVGYCRIDGKMIHPIMYDHSIPGYGPARRCEKRKEAMKEEDMT